MLWTVVLEKTLESPLDCKVIKPVNPKGNQSVLHIHWSDWCWTWSSNTSATWDKLTHYKRRWCWERLKAGGEGDDRRWGGWMASPTRWTWVWASSGSWWWTGRLGMGSPWGLQELDRTQRLNWLTDGKCANTFEWYSLFFVFKIMAYSIAIIRTKLGKNAKISGEMITKYIEFIQVICASFCLLNWFLWNVTMFPEETLVGSFGKVVLPISN